MVMYRETLRDMLGPLPPAEQAELLAAMIATVTAEQAERDTTSPH